ncbi:MAG: hypothetical protein HRT73_07280 [Flavobacteriales bacterium]|nr:hypothetical protein [Flavobacteriales bacterium]
MKIIIIIVLLGLGISNLFAQVAPGYMGKRLIIEYSGSTAPALFRPNKNGENGLFSWNYGHKITANYSLNRKVAVGASFELYKTGVDYDGLGFVEGRGDNNFGGTERSFFSPNGYGIANIKGLSIFRAKYKNGITPLGKYSVWGLKLLFVSTDLSEVKFRGFKPSNNSNIDEEVFLDLPKGGMNTTEWGVFYGAGVNRIIKDRIVISLGFELAFTWSAMGEFFGDNNKNYDFTDYNALGVSNSPSYNNGNVTSIEEAFQKISTERTFTSQFFNLKIGIGFLAY